MNSSSSLGKHSDNKVNDSNNVYITVKESIIYDIAPHTSDDGILCDYNSVITILKALGKSNGQLEVDLRCSSGAENYTLEWHDQFWSEILKCRELFSTVTVLLGDFALHRLPNDIKESLISSKKSSGEIIVELTEEAKNPIFEIDGRIKLIGDMKLGVYRQSSTRTFNKTIQKCGNIGEHQYQVIASSGDLPFYVIVEWNGIQLHVLAGHFCECTKINGDVHKFMNNFLTNDMPPEITCKFKGATEEQLEIAIPQLLRQSSSTGKVNINLLRQISNTVSNNHLSNDMNDDTLFPTYSPKL